MDISVPTRGVVLVAKALDVELEIKPLNLYAGEHMTSEFLKVRHKLFSKFKSLKKFHRNYEKVRNINEPN